MPTNWTYILRQDTSDQLVGWANTQHIPRTGEAVVLEGVRYRAVEVEHYDGDETCVYVVPVANKPLCCEQAEPGNG